MNLSILNYEKTLYFNKSVDCSDLNEIILLYFKIIPLLILRQIADYKTKTRGHSLGLKFLRET
ncbi:hypothetical protein ACX3PU_06370 [Chryseobacterium sp. A301]